MSNIVNNQLLFIDNVTSEQKPCELSKLFPKALIFTDNNELYKNGMQFIPKIQGVHDSLNRFYINNQEYILKIDNNNKLFLDINVSWLWYIGTVEPNVFAIYNVYPNSNSSGWRLITNNEDIINKSPENNNNYFEGKVSINDDKYYYYNYVKNNENEYIYSSSYIAQETIDFKEHVETIYLAFPQNLVENYNIQIYDIFGSKLLDMNNIHKIQPIDSKTTMYIYKIEDFNNRYFNYSIFSGDYNNDDKPKINNLHVDLKAPQFENDYLEIIKSFEILDNYSNNFLSSYYKISKFLDYDFGYTYIHYNYDSSNKNKQYEMLVFNPGINNNNYNIYVNGKDTYFNGSYKYSDEKYKYIMLDKNNLSNANVKITYDAIDYTHTLGNYIFVENDKNNKNDKRVYNYEKNLGFSHNSKTNYSYTNSTLYVTSGKSLSSASPRSTSDAFCENNFSYIEKNNDDAYTFIYGSSTVYNNYQYIIDLYKYNNEYSYSLGFNVVTLPVAPSFSGSCVWSDYYYNYELKYISYDYFQEISDIAYDTELNIQINNYTRQNSLTLLLDKKIFNEYKDNVEILLVSRCNDHDPANNKNINNINEALKYYDDIASKYSDIDDVVLAGYELGSIYTNVKENNIYIHLKVIMDKISNIISGEKNNYIKFGYKNRNYYLCFVLEKKYTDDTITTSIMPLAVSDETNNKKYCLRVKVNFL